MTVRGFLFDANRCTGCQACELGCTIENSLPWGTSWRQVETFNRHHREEAPTFHLSLACNHCLDAPCVDHCPALAIDRSPETSAVLINPLKCIGCGYCSWACPFDAPLYDSGAGVMTKCTFCDHRLESGLEPACVSACPTGCLDYGEISAAASERRMTGFPDRPVEPLIRFTALEANRNAPESRTFEPESRTVERGSNAPRALPPRERRRTVTLAGEWPLAAFTLVFACLVSLHAWLLSQGAPRYSAVVLATSLTAALLSTHHLGRRARAWRAVLNLRRSWLSREVAAYGLFVGLAAAWHSGLPQIGSRTVGLAALGIGMFGLYAVDRVYDLANERGRSKPHSADIFWTGGLLISLALSQTALALAILGFKLILYLRRSWSGTGPGAPELVAAGPGAPAVCGPWWLRPALSVVGIALWLSGPASELPGIGTILLAEILDRCQFYSQLSFPSPARQMAIDLHSAVRKGAPLVLIVALFLAGIVAPGAAVRGTSASAEAPEPPCTPGSEAANRLAGESSPYLLLHACNPVEWYPWGEGAIERARRENRPIFLSIGYSTCFWCHVMERRVFTDPQLAGLMNRWFVNIKVDREERPDLDEIYMTATQLLTGGGGWPNSVFLTPSLEPFFAGTYFPPTSAPGRPGFDTVLARVHEVWTERQAEVAEIAAKVRSGMAEVLEAQAAPAAAVSAAASADVAIGSLKSRFDRAHGGFGGAPKFPSPANLQLLVDAAAGGDSEAGEMVEKTLEEMRRGGIFDHLGGGFHRYSTDAAWQIPHFEKMLYDNALLAELLVGFGTDHGRPALIAAGRATLDFMLDDMQLPAGGFKSAIDAETDGEEGAFYTWTRSELASVLGERFDFLGAIYGFDGPPNFEGNRYTLVLRRPLAAIALEREVSEGELRDRVRPLEEALLRVRARREHPLVDDKVLTDWNGMALSALARAGGILEEERYTRAAATTATFLLGAMRSSDGGLLHVWRDGVARIPAYLDDYAYFVRGLIDLHRLTGERKWLEEAVDLADEMERRLRIPSGGYYLNAASPDLLFQPATVLDGATPAANGIAIQNLLAIAELTGRELYLRRAEAAMRAFARDLDKFPQAAQSLALAVRQYHRATRLGRPAHDPSHARTDTESAAPGAALADAPAVVTGRGEVEAGWVEPGWGEFSLTLSIADGWHLNANPASADYLVPTRVEGPVRGVEYPEGERMSFAFADFALAVYSGELVLEGELEAGRDRLTVTFQPCDERRCLRPQTLEIALDPPASP